jgi:hypothetical protein
VLAVGDRSCGDSLRYSRASRVQLQCGLYGAKHSHDLHTGARIIFVSCAAVGAARGNFNQKPGPGPGPGPGPDSGRDAAR